MEKRNYIFIDALRGCAALLVMFYHLTLVLKWRWIPEHPLPKVFFAGWIGVDLFFVISGFVISLSIFHGMERSGTLGFVRDYARHRLARIVPLYYLTTLIFIIFVDATNFWQRHHSGWRLENIISHLLFVHNTSLSYAFSINISAWSLGVEMQFYVLIAMVLMLLPKKRPFSLMLCGIAIASLWNIFCYWKYQGNINLMLLSSAQIFSRLDAFSIGAAAALVSRDGGRAVFKYIQPSARNTIVWGLLAVAFSLLAWRDYWMQPHFDYWQHASSFVVARITLLFGFIFFILMAVTLPEHRRLIIAFAPLLYLGKISYGVYLWHYPVMASLSTLDLPEWKTVVLIIISTLALASLSWHFFEKPFIDRYRRRMSTPQR